MMLIEVANSVDKASINDVVTDLLKNSVYQGQGVEGTAQIKADTASIPSHRITQYRDMYTGNQPDNIIIDYSPIITQDEQDIE